MEKHTAHYHLSVVKAEVHRLGAKAFTRSALEGGRRLGLSLGHMQRIIGALESAMLYKSMTSYADHTLWQDVYHTRTQGLEIYIKVTCRRCGGPPVISFKEKNT